MSKRELLECLKTVEQENEQLRSTLRNTADELAASRRDLDQVLADADGARLALRQMMRERAATGH